MNTLLKRPLSKVAAALFAAMTLVAASPALANTTANAAATASADVTEPLRDAQGDTMANREERLGELFASWSTVETSDYLMPGAPATILEQPTISVPSRMPLAGGRMSSG